jgi:hypothetical protein
MTMAATYAFGANNFISFEPKAAFKDYTKKPKVVAPIDPSTITPIAASIESVIEIQSSFLIYKEYLIEISIISQSVFSLALPISNNCDPLFEKVALLMPCDSSPIIDIKGHDVNPINALSYSTLQSKWDSGSAKFDGTINSVLTVPHDDIFRLRNDSTFCIEFWFYADEAKFGSTLNRKILLTFANTLSSINWTVMLSSYGFVYLSTSQNMDTVSNSTSSNLANLKGWNYVRVTNSAITLNDVTRTFKINLGAATATATSSYTLQIGGTSKAGMDAYCLNGYMADIRITIGDSRETDSLPPTKAFPKISCIGTTPVTPVVTPKDFKPYGIIELNSSATFNAYPPIHCEAISPITLNAVTDFIVMPTIRFAATSEIAFFNDWNLKQIKIELVYLPVENRSKASTGFVDKLLDGVGVAGILDNGTIELYTGSRPHSANHAVTGTLLGTIKNIKFDRPFNRIIRKDSSKTWMMKAENTGLIGWFRIKADAEATDYGQDSVREVRLDGEAGVDTVSFNFTVIAGETYHIEDFVIMWGNG